MESLRIADVRISVSFGSISGRSFLQQAASGKDTCTEWTLVRQ